MSISCGFYNSLNGDRRYGSPQMSALFDGVINDGVFMNVGGALMTTPGTGMSVVVAPGRAWFERTWTYNDSDYPLTISPSEVVLNRIDAIVLETNSSDEVRSNTIKVIKGVPNANATKPELTNSDLIHQHALAYVTVKAGVTEITEADIEIMVGKTECPFVTAILETTDISDLMNQWQAQFDAWFANVEYTLSGDAAGKLQAQIDSIRKEIDIYTPYQVGDIKISALINSDPNWALCNGDAIDENEYPQLSGLSLIRSFDMTGPEDLYALNNGILPDSDRASNYRTSHSFNNVVYTMWKTVADHIVILYRELGDASWKYFIYSDAGGLIPTDFWIFEHTLLIACTSTSSSGIRLIGITDITNSDIFDIDINGFTGTGNSAYNKIRYSEKDQCWYIIHYTGASDRARIYPYVLGTSSPGSYAYELNFESVPTCEAIDGHVYVIGQTSSTSSQLYLLEKSRFKSIVSGSFSYGSSASISFDLYRDIVNGFIAIEWAASGVGKRWRLINIDGAEETSVSRIFDLEAIGIVDSEHYNYFGFYLYGDSVYLLAESDQISMSNYIILEYKKSEVFSSLNGRVYPVGIYLQTKIIRSLYDELYDIEHGDSISENPFIMFKYLNNAGNIFYGWLRLKMPEIISTGVYYYMKIKG